MKIILLFGGESNERLVSVGSAQTMARALPDAKLWFWHKNGQIFELDYNFLMQHKDPFINELILSYKPTYNTINDAINCPSTNDNIFLLGLHGGAGENGFVQELLEKAGKPFTGSNSLASRRAFDKLSAKGCLLRHNIKMAPHVIVQKVDNEAKEKLRSFYETHGALVVKPTCSGSSLGCFFVKSSSDIDKALAELKRLSPQEYLVEKMIRGRELTVGVIDSEHGPVGLSGTEIVLDEQRDFDYQGKYLGTGAKEVTPPDMSSELIARAQQLAVKAHLALGLFGYSRTDMILADDGFYYLETNTLPGLSERSIIPQQLKVQGISVRDFLIAQLELAGRR